MEKKKKKVMVMNFSPQKVIPLPYNHKIVIQSAGP
jgi:hypothetical protein